MDLTRFVKKRCGFKLVLLKKSAFVTQSSKYQNIKFFSLMPNKCKLIKHSNPARTNHIAPLNLKQQKNRVFLNCGKMDLTHFAVKPFICTHRQGIKNTKCVSKKLAQNKQSCLYTCRSLINLQMLVNLIIHAKKIKLITIVKYFLQFKQV